MLHLNAEILVHNEQFLPHVVVVVVVFFEGGQFLKWCRVGGNRKRTFLTGEFAVMKS